MTTICDHYNDSELETILRITQLVLSKTRGFRIPERDKTLGLTVSELVDIKRKIERVLEIPGTLLVDYSKPRIKLATTNQT